MAPDNQMYTIEIQPTTDKAYSHLQKGMAYTITAKVTPENVSLDVYTKAPTFYNTDQEFSSIVANDIAITYFYNGRRAAEMKDVIAKGFDQIFKRQDYPQAIKNALTATIVNLQDKLGIGA